MRHLVRIVIAVLVVWIGASFWMGRPIRHEPGVLIPNPPRQEEMAPLPMGQAAGFPLTAVAKYTVRGRVLGTKRYFSGAQSKLVPRDVALGWGRMSDQSILDGLKLSMGNRFFFYEWQSAPPIPAREIMQSAANHHVIAADRNIARAAANLRIGAVVEMEGFLVNADGPGGWRWPTSLRRDDTGNGACELFYARSVRILQPADLRSPGVSAPVASAGF